VRWLWENRVPLGALTLLDGDPGDGKSSINYDLTARVSTGRPMPESDAPSSPAGVVLIQAEDSLGATVKPTLQRLGADLKRVRVYDRRQFLQQPLMLPDDVPLIERGIQEVNARLAVVDPLSAFLAGNSNSDQSVRRALGPLAALAERASCAIVVVRHLTKASSVNAIYRGAGSMGIIALARSALLVATDPTCEDPFHHILVQTKTNLAVAASLRYRTLKEKSVILIDWLGESPHTANALFAVGRDNRPALTEAIEVLRAILSDGPIPASEALRIAREAGVAKRTLDRARKYLGVIPKRVGRGWSVHWTWTLPSPEPLGQNNGSDVASTGNAVAKEVKGIATQH
jgi:hypothetical protein